jgi:hypothetical protein
MKIDNINITIKELASDIVYHAQLFNENYDPEYHEKDCDVRLQIVDGSYQVHWGDPGYDTDHRGFWGVSSLRLNMTKKECYSTAKELLDDAEDSYYCQL